MTSAEVNAIRDFRRFINTYIYPETYNIIINEICFCLNPTCIGYEAQPQPLIKFDSTTIKNNGNNAVYIEQMHTALKRLFVEFFNSADIIKIIRSNIYKYIKSNEAKEMLNIALTQIQMGNPQYVSLLFNVTVVNNSIYLYL